MSAIQQQLMSYGGSSVPVVTWNSATKGADITLDTGDLRATKTAFTAQSNAMATYSRSSGKMYCEMLMSQVSSNVYPHVGIALATVTGTSALAAAGRWVISVQNGQYFDNSAGFTATYSTFASADVLNIAVDISAGKLWLGKNGTWFNSGDPAAGTGNLSTTSLTGNVLPVCGSPSSSQWRVTGRFKSSDFTYSVPSGFSAWGA